MKIILDTTKKTIELLEPITIDEILSNMEDMFDDWRDYKIISTPQDKSSVVSCRPLTYTGGTLITD